MVRNMTLPTFINWRLDEIPNPAAAPVRGDETPKTCLYQITPEAFSLSTDQVPPKESTHSSMADAFQLIVLEADRLKLGGWTIRSGDVDPIDAGD